MNTKKFEVAILYDRSGNVIAVGKCKLVSDKEYKDLLKNMELELARTIVMTLMVFLQNWHTLNCKSETESIFKTNIFQNPLVFISIALAIGLQFLIVEVPPIAAALGLTSIPFTSVLAMLGIAMVILVVMETYKYFVRRYRKKHNIKRAY